MRELTRWDPWGDLISLRGAMDRLLKESFVRPRAGLLIPSARRSLALDVYETQEEVVVKASVPGMKPEEIEVTITGDILTIKGETKEETEEKGRNYILQECQHGAFARAVALPSSLQTDKIEASFEDGMLTLSIPKAEDVRPKTIRVKTS